MTYTGELARDYRFRSKLKYREFFSKYRSFFFLHLGRSTISSKHNILKRKMIRYGFSLPVKRCLLTGRGRGLVGDFRISRHKFKTLIEQGFFTGITKSSW